MAVCLGEVGVITDCRIASLHLTTVARGKLNGSLSFRCLGNGIMQIILEYHRFAEECRKLAQVLINPRHKQKIQEMAAAWDMLAVERKSDLDEKNSATRG